MNNIVKFALGLANVPAETVADIDKSLPGMARLIEDAKQLEPILRAAEPHIEALMPLIMQALPVLKAAYPDFVAVLPTAQEIVAFVNDKKTA
jgi:phage-related protein